MKRNGLINYATKSSNIRYGKGAYLLKFFRERTRWKCFSDSHFNGKTTEVTFKNNKWRSWDLLFQPMWCKNSQWKCRTIVFLCKVQYAVCAINLKVKIRYPNPSLDQVKIFNSFPNIRIAFCIVLGGKGSLTLPA